MAREGSGKGRKRKGKKRLGGTILLRSYGGLAAAAT